MTLNTLSNVAVRAHVHRESAFRLPPGGGYWLGRWQNADVDATVHDPENGQPLWAVASADVQDVDAALAHLATSCQEAWPLWQRREVLARAAELVEENRERLAHIISSEGCKTLREANNEVSRARETLRLSSEQASRLGGETLAFGETPRGDGRLGWYSREPVGVVAAITPYNDPLNLVAHKVGPALIAGNAVLLKPHEQTPMTALALLEILLEAGLPASRLAVLPGDGRTIGTPIVADERVDLVSFTGGYSTGNVIARAAGPKKLLMELGGNAPLIVLADSDWEAAAGAAVDGAFGVAGQNCLSVQRVFVEAPVASAFLARVVELTEQLTVGSKQDAATDVGPLVSEAHARRIEEWVTEACEAGARLLTGGHRDGAFYAPTVLTNVPAHADIMREEIFGPVVILESVDDIASAIERANDTPYGLQAGVFARDIDLALGMAERLHFGAVMINDSSDFRIDSMPFGGRGRSGIGREGIRYAVEAMSEPKVIGIRRQDRLAG